MQPRISFHLIPILLIWMHSSIAQTTALWFIVYLILAAIVIAISNVPSPTRNPKKVNIAETPESHATEDVALGQTSVGIQATQWICQTTLLDLTCVTF